MGESQETIVSFTWVNILAVVGIIQHLEPQNTFLSFYLQKNSTIIFRIINS